MCMYAYVPVCLFVLYKHTYRICFNFRGVKLSWITNLRGFRVFIFTVCDVIAQALPVWSKFLRDETFVDSY